jgi:hypothetical protein
MSATKPKKLNRAQQSAKEKSALWREDLDWAEKHFGGEPLDPGIIRLLRILKEHGIETCQCCEGPDGMQPEGRHGVGHSYRAPTVDVTYQPWAALDIAMQYGVRVDRISEVFRVRDWRPVEQLWRIEFNSGDMERFRRSWYGKVNAPALETAA